VEERQIRDFWSARPRVQELVVRTLLDKINLAMPGSPGTSTEHGRELASSVRVRYGALFDMLKMAGRPAAIPKVTWDAGHESMGW
jgi:hypothetical protein